MPILLAFIYFLNTFLHYYNVDNSILSHIAGISIIPLIFMYISSYVFKFCSYHRMFLHYIVVIELINMYDWYIGIPLNAKEFFMFNLIISGIFLFIILYLYGRSNKKTIT